MNSFYFDKMHMLYNKKNHMWSNVKNIAFENPLFSKKNVLFSNMCTFVSHCFETKNYHCLCIYSVNVLFNQIIFCYSLVMTFLLFLIMLPTTIVYKHHFNWFGVTLCHWPAQKSFFLELCWIQSPKKLFLELCWIQVRWSFRSVHW